MATLVGTQSDHGKLLNSLIELDLDAIEAYRAAVDKLQDAKAKKALGEFLQDHQRHVDELTPHAKRYAGKAADKADAKAVLTTGKVKLASLVGDKAILLAMITNENDTNTAYERAIAHEGFDAALKSLLQKNLGDERRHREWLQKAVH